MSVHIRRGPLHMDPCLAHGKGIWNIQCGPKIILVRIFRDAMATFSFIKENEVLRSVITSVTTSAVKTFDVFSRWTSYGG